MNYVRNSALKHRIFKKLCNEMGSEFEVLLYYSNVRWLSRGKVLSRVFTFCFVCLFTPPLPRDGSTA